MHGAGTTATVLYMRGKELWVASVGDSRAVLGSRRGRKLMATDLSVDHKLEIPTERARIDASGGQVRPASGGKSSTLRVWADGAVGLAMSRSIGDGALKPLGVIAEPEVTHSTLHPAIGKGDGDLFLLVASDGVWEFIPSQEAAGVIGASLADATKGCDALVALAAERWREHEAYHRDDITAIVAFLPFLEEDQPTAGAAAAHLAATEGASQGVDAARGYASPPLCVQTRAPSSGHMLVRSGDRHGEAISTDEIEQSSGSRRLLLGEGARTSSTAAGSERESEGDGHGEDEEGFSQRYLSTFNPYGEGVGGHRFSVASPLPDPIAAAKTSQSPSAAEATSMADATSMPAAEAKQIPAASALDQESTGGIVDVAVLPMRAAETELSMEGQELSPIAEGTEATGVAAVAAATALVDRAISSALAEAPAMTMAATNKAASSPATHTTVKAAAAAAAEVGLGSAPPADLPTLEHGTGGAEGRSQGRSQSTSKTPPALPLPSARFIRQRTASFEREQKRSSRASAAGDTASAHLSSRPSLSDQSPSKLAESYLRGPLGSSRVLERDGAVFAAPPTLPPPSTGYVVRRASSFEREQKRLHPRAEL